MLDQRAFLVMFALAAGAGLPFACTSQTIDAVEIMKRLDGGTEPDGQDDAARDADAADDATGDADAADGGADALPPDSGEEPDGDGDGVPDSTDECPQDPEKIRPGTCGCGLDDPLTSEGRPTCIELQQLLAHRYTFLGPSGSTAIVDSIAGRDGVAMNATLSGTGTLDLAGGTTDQYVDLPNGLLSSLPPRKPQLTLPSATLEAWVRWNGGDDWQRVFDFGSNDATVENRQSMKGTTYLFMTARTKLLDTLRFQTGKLRVAYKGPGTDDRELFVEASIALPSGREAATHVAVVVDAELQTMSLYVDGEIQQGRAMLGGIVDSQTNTVTTPYDSINEAGPYSWAAPLADGGLPPAVDLSGISDINNWLGRSQFVGDPELSATLEEFRIYAGALGAELIGISANAGPNPAFLPEPLRAGD